MNTFETTELGIYLERLKYLQEVTTLFDPLYVNDMERWHTDVKETKDIINSLIN